jgi:putative salt-induced outer membrane protein YdiY
MLRIAKGVCCCAAVFFAAHALAEDFVLMKNGDRITGSVKKIWDEEVFIEPKYGDEYAIKIEYVAYVHTEESFEVVMRRGRRTETVVGRLGLGADQQPVVTTESGRVIPLAKIDNMIEIDDFFDWKIVGELTGNLSTGNTNTSNARFYTLGELKLGEHQHSLELVRNEQRTDDELTRDQSDVTYSDVWTYTGDWFLRGTVAYTRDPIRELQGRSSLFLGPGYHFWSDSKRTLNLSVGPSYLYEDIGGVTNSAVAVQTAFRYEQQLFRDDLDLFWRFDITKYVKGRENRIVVSSLGLNFDFTDDIYLSLQMDVNYESHPAQDQLNQDVTFLLGAGIKLD